MVIKPHFLLLNHTIDLTVGTLVTTLPGTWHYKISAWIVWPSVSLLSLSVTASLIFSVYPSVAVYRTVGADPNLRHTSLLPARFMFDSWALIWHLSQLCSQFCYTQKLHVGDSVLFSFLFIFILYYIIWYCIVSYYIALYHNMSYWIRLYHIYYSVLQSILLHYAVLGYILVLPPPPPTPLPSFSLKSKSIYLSLRPSAFLLFLSLFFFFFVFSFFFSSPPPHFLLLLLKLNDMLKTYFG